MTIDGTAGPERAFRGVNAPATARSPSGSSRITPPPTRAANRGPRRDGCVREAAERGAQIICLKELFNAPYFCKSQKCERFDLAEPIPGPDDRRACRRSRRSWRSCSSCRSSSARRPASIATRRRSSTPTAALLGVYRKMHIPDDPLFNEKYYFTPGDGADDRIDDRRVRAGERLPRLEDALRDHRRADLLGPVVSRGGAHHAACSAPTSSSIRRRSAGTRRRRRSGARRRSTRGGRSSARTRSPTASTSRRRIASATRTSRAPTASSSSATRSSPIRSAAILAEAGDGRGDPDRAVRSGADRGHAAQLAVPARSPHRRLRADPRAVSRDDRRFAPPLAVARRMGAARATWIAWPHHEPDWPGKLGADPVGVRGDRARARATRARRDPLPRRRRARDARAPCSRRTACARTHAAARRARPIASGCATRAPTCVLDDDGSVVAA